MPKTPKIVFFDIDGTLLSTGGAGQLAMERALIEEFRIDFPFEKVLTAGRTDRGITDEIFERYGFENTRPNRERFRDAYLSRLPETLCRAPGQLLPEVKALLSALSAIQELTLSILTGNYELGAWIKLKHYELSEFFEFGGFGDEHSDRDDVARNALTAAQAAIGDHVEGQHTMVIGDTAADIRCARAIGAKAVAVATGTYQPEELQPHNPDLLFDDFSNTTAVVDSILQAL